jgi:TPR repeat protein
LPQDYAEAARFFRKAADQQNPKAQYLLGMCYEKGRGVEQDAVEAKKWYESAAAKGDIDARNRLNVNLSGLPVQPGK